MRLKYLGNAAFEIHIVAGGSEKRLVIDPFISENQMCPITVDDLNPLDIILVTHGAFDHFGDTTELAKKTNALVVCDPAVRIHLIREGIPEERIRLIVWGMSFDVEGVNVRALKSDHISFFESGGNYITGLPQGYLISGDSGFSVYHLGDTAIFSDLQLFGELYQPRLVLVPVGAAPGAHAELSYSEAALAVKWLRAEVAIPMHYQPGSKEPKLFMQCAKAEAPQTKVMMMAAGETIDFNETAQTGGNDAGS